MLQYFLLTVTLQIMYLNIISLKRNFFFPFLRVENGFFFHSVWLKFIFMIYRISVVKNANIYKKVSPRKKK